jgi:predicted secreted protein
MTQSIHRVLRLPWLAVFLSFSAFAAETPTIIDLSAEASRPAANDLVRATVSVDAAGPTIGELAKQVNNQIADALKVAKGYPSIKTQSGASNTYPSYSKLGKIESWRMHSELSVESGDPAALSELLGKLQTALAVSNVAMQPSPETRKKAENEAMLDALDAFKVRAKVLADALGKPYSIKQLTVSTNGRIVQPMYRSAAKAIMSEATPMPIESGESQVSASVSGQIELE